jgi:membrane protease YdiL (CAAX protease family)
MLAFAAIYFLLVVVASGGLESVNAEGGIILFQLLAILPFIWLLGMHLTQRINARFFFSDVIKPFTWGRLFLIWLSLLIASYGLEGLTNVAIARFSPAYAEELFAQEILDDDLSLSLNVMTIVLATVVGPMMEEIVFRGLLLQRLMIKYGPSAAILASSFLFGILHFESWVSATLFGLVMSLVYLASRNLWVPIILHIANNVVSVVLNVVEHDNQPDPIIDYLYDQFWYYLAALLIMPGLYILAHQLWPDKGMEIPYDYNLNNAS